MTQLGIVGREQEVNFQVGILLESPEQVTLSALGLLFCRIQSNDLK